MTSQTKAHLAVLIANIFFGTCFSAVKLLTTQFIPPFGLNVIRVGVCIPLFWLLFLFKPSNPGIRKEDIPRFLLCALCGIVLNQILFIKGLSLTSSIHGSLLALGTPIFITAAAGWLLKEEQTVKKTAGLVLGVTGAGLLVFSGRHQGGGSNVLLGDFFILVNSMSYALYFVWVRPLMERYPPIHVLRWVFTFGAFIIIPIGIPDFLSTNFSLFTPVAWVALALVVLGATFTAYLFNMYGIKYLGPSITGTYIYSQPIFATIIGLLLLHETLGWPQIIAALAIGTGVFLVTRKK